MVDQVPNLNMVNFFGFETDMALFYRTLTHQRTIDLTTPQNQATNLT